MSRKPKPRTIRMIVDNRLENVFLAGLAVQSFAMYSPLSERDAYNVRISLVEAVNSAILYSLQSGQEDEVEVIVSLHPDCMVLQVCDDASEAWFDPGETEPVGPEGPGSLSERDMGRFIIRAVMDEVGAEKVGNRNVVTMVKSFGGKRLEF